MVLYHADRENTLSEGATLLLQKDYDLYNEHQNVFRELYPDGLSKHGIHYVQNVSYPMSLIPVQIPVQPPKCQPFIQPVDISNANSILGSTVCEYQFELVRKAFYPQMPSRLQSLFAVEQLDDLTQWSNVGITADCAVYEIQLDFEPHRFDSSWLRGGFCIETEAIRMTLAFSPAKNLSLAFQYWNGTPSSAPRWEYIVPLPVVIGRRVR